MSTQSVRLQFPKKEESIHPSLFLLLFMVCSAAMTVVCSMYMMNGMAVSIFKFIWDINLPDDKEELSRDIYKSVTYHVDSGLREVPIIAPQVTSLGMLMLSVGLGISTVTRGVVFTSNIVVCVLMALIAVMNIAMQVVIVLDMHHLPAGGMGILETSSNGFIYSVQQSILFPDRKYENYTRRSRLDVLHEELNCCGVMKADDYFSGNLIEFYTTEPRLPPFRFSQQFAVDQMKNLTTRNGTTEGKIMVAPKSCCRFHKEGCNMVEVNSRNATIHWDSKKLYSTGCLVAFLRKSRALVCLTAFMNTLFLSFTVAHIINLILLRRRHHKKRLLFGFEVPKVIATFVDD